jgi:hypothetical protein
VENRRSKSEVIIGLLEQHFAAQPTQTPYELACEAGFIASLDLDENAAAENRQAVRAAIQRKHAHTDEPVATLGNPQRDTKTAGRKTRLMRNSSSRSVVSTAK